MNVQIKNLDMASEVQVYDNFLSETDLNKLDNLILHNDHFPYFFNDYKVDEGDEFAQFTHYFYQNNIVSSNFYDGLIPIIKKLNVMSLIRIKANLQLKDTKIKPTAMHYDVEVRCQEQKTGIFYMNTNNGKTIFEDGENIDSIKNRMIIFPTSKRHAGTTHTDTMYRCVINFNWI